MSNLRAEPGITHLAYVPEIAKAIAKWAADDPRSVNAQIESAIRLALKEAGRDPKSK